MTTPSSDFTDNGDGTITHKKTQLTWKRCSEGQTWNGSTCTGTASGYSHAQATALTSNFAGQSDWRLPDVQELRSIVEYAAVSPAINTSIFPATPLLLFWTSTSYAPVPAVAWFVDFNDGGTSAYGKTGTGHVRLVRSGQFLDPLPVVITPNTLSVTAPATLQSAGRTQLSASASYSDNSSKPITATWSSSNPAVATVSVNGELAAGSVTVDTPVTITASYSEAGTTVSASQTLTITAAPASLASVAVSGGTTVTSGGLLRLKATATYSDGSSRSIYPTEWTTTLGTINTRGELSASSVTTDTPLTVTASYSEGGISKTASFAITIKATPATLSSLGLVLPKGTLASGESMQLAAESGYSDGSGKRISVAWELSDASIASITTAGMLTAKTVNQDTPLVITASYSEGGQTLTARYSVIIQAQATPQQLTAEVIATLNAKNEAKLNIWFNTNAGATVLAGKTFKLYVAALVPASPLVSTPTFFLINRSKVWQALSWPLAEYLSGVNAGDWQLIELLDGVDTRVIAGAQILVGYGESDTEMLEAGRYSVVYQLP